MLNSSMRVSVISRYFAHLYYLMRIFDIERREDYFTLTLHCFNYVISTSIIMIDIITFIVSSYIRFLSFFSNSFNTSFVLFFH